MSRSIILLGLFLIPGPGLLGLGTLRAADDPPKATSLLFLSSDLTDMAGQFQVPRDGTYTVKVWTTSLPDQSFIDDDEALEDQPLILKTKPEDPDDRPKWEYLGQRNLAPDKPLIVRIEPLDPKRPSMPSLFSLSTDPDFTPTKALDLLRSQVKTLKPTLDRRRTVVRTNQEGADFQPPTSPRAWRERAQAVREQLLVTLGLWPMLPRTELNPRVVGTLERDGYSIEKVVLETLPGFFLAGNVYRPSKVEGRRPVVLCPHGHWPEGRVNEDVQSRCVRLAQLGCVVYLYDMVGYADNKPFGHSFMSDRLRRWGLSLPGLQTWNSIRALDWLLSRPDVDPTRVAITGESGGGTQTFLLTAIDDRIKVAAPVVMVSDGFQGGCVCENGPGLRIGTDNIEIAALTAPRPMKLVGASGDWTARTMTNALPSLQMVYAQTGATTHISGEVFDFPHNYNQTSRNAIYSFLAHWLLGNDDVESTREGTLKLEDPKDLFVFNESNPYPSDAKSPYQLETDLIEVLGRQLDKLAPGAHAAPWEASRNLLMTALKVRVGLEVPIPREATAKETRRVERDGLTIIHSTVARKGEGDQIAVVRLTPAHSNGRLTVLFTPRGKADLTDPEGSPTPMAQALLDRGQSVVGFDPLLIGESHDSTAPTSKWPITLHFDCYNPSLPADRAQDLATVVSWARALADVREVNLVATTPLALLARPMLEGISRTAIDLGGFEYGDGSKAIPPGLDLPGVLQFGGLKTAAALIAPAPLWIIQAPESFDAAWPTNAYGLIDAGPFFKLDRGTVEAQAIAKWIDLGE
jgi:hypothetical protein